MSSSASAHPHRRTGRSPRVLLALALALLSAVGAPVVLAQIDPEALRQRGQMEREQQNEEMVRRLRQGSEMQDARTRGVDPARLRQLELDQLNERAAQDRLHREQLQRLQSLPPNSTTSPAVEAQRAARERATQGARIPSWGPVLDPAPAPRGPLPPSVAK